MAALVMTLLGPSPLVRVHKVACLIAGLLRLPGQREETACLWLRSALASSGAALQPELYMSLLSTNLL